MAEYNAFPVSLGHGDEVIAFDLGRTSFRSALLTRNGVLSHAQRIPSLNCRSLPGRSPDDIVHEIATYVADTVQGLRYASGLGAACLDCYPDGAALNAHTGKILGSGQILGEGSPSLDLDSAVKHIHFLSAFPDQAKAITDALHQWKFKPYVRDGKPAEIESGILFGTAPFPEMRRASSSSVERVPPDSAAINARICGMSFLKAIWNCALILGVFLAACSAQNFADVKPTPQQTEWQDLEMGAIIHFGTNTFVDREWGDGTADPKVFDPTAFNAEHWMQALQSAGIKYVVLVAKHHDGFCLWPTGQTDYSVKSSPWENGHGNVVRQVEQAARKFGLKFGVYLSPWDRHEPKYNNPPEYDKYYAAELDELAQGYGDLEEFWLDGAGSEGHVYNFPRIIEELRTYQPNTLVFADVGLFEYGDIRWVGNEEGIIPYENWNVIDRHGYLRWRPVEVDTPLRKLHWFWHPNDEASLKTVPELLSLYEQSVGHGGQLVLGIAPDRRGLLPDVDVARLKEFGSAVRELYGKNLALQHTRAADNENRAFDGNPDTFWSAPVGSHHATLELNFDKPVTFNRVLMMEWLNDGQHVQKYSIEVNKSEKWVSIAQGQAIGHKRIYHFAPVTASKVRLNILSSSAEAHIREFQIFSPDVGN